uniref:Uncharacterized protein n=1 Tax=Denticeps clupeoides TaxID=299321 RepID=A0AAY4A5Q8_9TELE
MHGYAESLQPWRAAGYRFRWESRVLLTAPQHPSLVQNNIEGTYAYSAGVLWAVPRPRCHSAPDPGAVNSAYLPISHDPRGARVATLLLFSCQSLGLLPKVGCVKC